MMVDGGTWTVITRDVDAMLIPNGMQFLIPAGTSVSVTQALGSAITIQVNGQLARIEAKDADALGLDPAKFAHKPDIAKDRVANGPVDKEQIWQELSTCFDPEIPINIVELGLVYTINVTSNDDFSQNKVMVEMTLTAPGCGMGPVIMQDVEAAVWRVPNVTDVKVELVFEPMWNQEMMTEAARLELGLL